MADRRRRVVWTKQAQTALNDILRYISQDSPRAARVVLGEMLGAAERLATLSERGRVVPELDDHSIREVFIGRYRLLYQVTPWSVVVLAILHGARDFTHWHEED